MCTKHCGILVGLGLVFALSSVENYMKNQNRIAPRLFLSAALITTVSTLISACGPQAFVPGTNRQTVTAGTSATAPKVDILISIDDKGAMQNIFPNMASEFDSFATSLENSGWNFRITGRKISQTTTPQVLVEKIATSRHDYNWYSQVGPSSWLSPYIGAVPGPNLGVDSNLWTQSGPSYFLPSSIWGNDNNGLKTGIENQIVFLESSDVSTKFLRPDAFLAVIVLSNSRDTSNANWSSGNPVYPANDLAVYKNRFLQVKNNAGALVKYYSLVAPTMQFNGGCRGANSFSGIRYSTLASPSYLNGANYDICTTTLTAALNGVAQNLTAGLQNFRKRYVKLNARPNPNTLKVYRNGALLPIDANSGWTYSDQSQTVYTVDGVVTNGVFAPMNLQQDTGYFVELHGTAKITGSDTIEVEYQNFGAVSAY
jgi:hypothetical protein